ncbi:MAG: polysaccharide biosynthesis/export family protein [Fibrobacter sp.]|jgi:polysaccharide export outer membrane protein|nr:polysaccharide biosynthesis/export family protein [Fibrobacter sp.]
MIKFLILFTAILLSGCFLAPQMRMSEPSDTASYGNATVYLHKINTMNSNDSLIPSSSVDVQILLSEDDSTGEYRIGPLDVLQVIVWEHPELTSPMGQYLPGGQLVSKEGTFFFPYAGEIKVAGLTTRELRNELTTRLSDKILTNPQVDVKVVTYNSSKAFVSGEVFKPGFVAFDEFPMTLPEALSRVGGLTKDANGSGILLRRGENVFKIDYYGAFESNLALDRLLLQPGDQLWVPSAMQSNVYVIGEVTQPSAVSTGYGRLSLMEALAKSGGLAITTASSGSIYVIRNTSDTRIDVFHLDAGNAMALAFAERFDLNPRDIVYVDASGLATWNRMISMILPSVQSVYYGVLTGRNIDSWFITK